MTNIVSRFVKDESGATAIEYALIAGGISVVIITAVNVGTSLDGTFNRVANLFAAPYTTLADRHQRPRRSWGLVVPSDVDGVVCV